MVNGTSLHYVPHTTSPIKTTTQLRRTDFNAPKIVDNKTKRFGYNEHTL